MIFDLKDRHLASASTGVEVGLPLLLRATARRHLRRLKGAKLAVLISLLLRSNHEGWIEASIPQLERETGYMKQSIEMALSGLCKLEVDGRRLVLAVPERKRIGIANRIHFRLFPTETEIMRFERPR